MIRTRDTFPARPFGRAWREVEMDDEGEIVLDVQPVHCPGCQHPLDLGGLDDIDVHRCGYCRKRTRFLWSDRQGAAVPDTRGPNPDWDAESGEDLLRDFDSDEDDDGQEAACVNGCEDPVFGGPAGEVCDGDRWVCAVCGSDGSAADDD